MPLKIIPTNLLAAYIEQTPPALQVTFNALHEAEVSTDTFSFYTSVASVFSNKIEGEDIELDSYIKHKAMGMEFKPDYLSIQEVFYYATFIHLVFVKIHPWDDGNGRSARLLEKWFLAQKLGEKAWFLQSEKMYYQQHHLTSTLSES